MSPSCTRNAASQRDTEATEATRYMITQTLADLSLTVKEIPIHSKPSTTAENYTSFPKHAKT